MTDLTIRQHNYIQFDISILTHWTVTTCAPNDGSICWGHLAFKLLIQTPTRVTATTLSAIDIFVLNILAVAVLVQIQLFRTTLVETVISGE